MKTTNIFAAIFTSLLVYNICTVSQIVAVSSGDFPEVGDDEQSNDSSSSDSSDGDNGGSGSK